MDDCMENLEVLLLNCRLIINKGYTCMQNTRLTWLNTFCLEFFKCSEYLHTFLLEIQSKQKNKISEHVETIYLCLTQIVTCIRHLEITIKMEDQLGAALSAARQHFLDRINCCLNRLRTCLKTLSSDDANQLSEVENKSFVDCVDAALYKLAPYSSYTNDTQTTVNESIENVTESHAEVMVTSQQIRSLINMILSHTLSFANVALKQDKHALSALCQKLLCECIAFQEECALGLKSGASFSDSNRKLKAISLGNALYHLEDFINEALLRLVYTCFLDFQKLSIERLRKAIQEREADDPELDELIADFDVNIDRITQIGIFAIAFAPNIKTKTTVQSSLASFESLDSCIIPSLQTKGSSIVFSQLLEQHFNEEAENFKNAIQKIIDSQAFASCYLDILTQILTACDKEYNKTALEDTVQMGQFLLEHFQLPANKKDLQKEHDLKELHSKFSLMLEECQAILKCDADQQVETSRVLKRFKILSSILRKLINKMYSKNANGEENNTQMFIMSEELNDSEQMFASLNISPSIQIILYNNRTPFENRRQQRLLNASLKANTSQMPLTPLRVNESNCNLPTTTKKCQQNNIKHMPVVNQQARASVRRKESLRTALFRRQKLAETERMCATYKNDSDSLQISEILNQLTDIHSNMSH